MAPTRANHKLNPCDPIVNVEGVLMLLQRRSEFQFEDVTWGKISFWWLSVQKVKLQHLSLRPTLKMGRGDLNIRQILILDLQLQVWSLEAQTSTIPLCRNADVGILHRNWIWTPQAAFEASVNLRASHRLSVCVDSPIFQWRKRGATAIIAESQRSRLSFSVEASGWACHCDGAVLLLQERCWFPTTLMRKSSLLQFFQLCSMDGASNEI